MYVEKINLTEKLQLFTTQDIDYRNIIINILNSTFIRNNNN